MNWEKMTREVENVYGMQVDWDERFFICPDCGEPVYEDDWDNDAYIVHGSNWSEDLHIPDDEALYICPICQFCIVG